MAQQATVTLKSLKEAFITADRDKDKLLRKDEFKEFVEIGYKKQCPDGMYQNLCSHFGRDPSIGIDWTTAKEVYLQSSNQNQRVKSNRAPSPSPSPAPSSNGVNVKQKKIKQVFIQCDKDADGYLNKREFGEFVKTGFKKAEVPQGMYEHVCSHFKRDPDVGMDWLSVYTLWKQSNPDVPSTPKRQPANPPTVRRMRSPGDNVALSPRAGKQATQSTSLSSTSTSSAVRQHKQHVPLSPTRSGSQHNKDNPSYSASSSNRLTESALRELDQSKGPMMAEDEESIGSTNSQLVSRRSHRRLMSKDRHGSASFDDGPDASQMMMQMLESKVKSYSQQLKLEVRKRKKTEELAQAALTQNEGYKQQIDELNSQTVKAQRTNKQLNERVRKLESIVDDDRATIKHLKQRCKEMESERDETFALLTKIEGQHAAMVKKEKSKHKSEMEKLSAGFLQSLGADPGTDVAAVVKELRTNNVKLQQEVDQLASRLARKNQSLMEALSAVNEITMEDEKKEQYQMNQAKQNGPLSPRMSHRRSPSNALKEKVKSFHQRRKSMRHSQNQSISDESTLSALGKLPHPPKRRNSQLGLTSPKSKPQHRPTATFFKDAVGDSVVNGQLPHPHAPSHRLQSPRANLTIANAKHGKELQFVSQQLTHEVSQKTESIENLQLANTALMQEMATMQMQMQQLASQNTTANKSSTAQMTHHESNSINDLP